MTALAVPLRKARSLWSMIGAFLRVEVVDDLSYPASFVMGELAVVAPVIASYFIGELTVGSEQSSLFGSDYFTFAVLGLGITSIMQSSLHGFGFALQRAQERGNLETYLVEPVSWTLLPLAMNVYRAGLGILNGSVILLMGWLLGARYDLAGLPMFLLIVLLGVVATQAIGILSASFLVLAKRSQGLIKLYTMAAALLAGSVFSVEQLPPWLQVFSWLLPHTYVVTSARDQLMTDSGSFSIPVGTTLWVLVVFSVVVLVGGLYLFRRALNYAREMGMLSGY